MANRSRGRDTTGLRCPRPPRCAPSNRPGRESPLRPGGLRVVCRGYAARVRNAIECPIHRVVAQPVEAGSRSWSRAIPQVPTIAGPIVGRGAGRIPQRCRATIEGIERTTAWCDPPPARVRQPPSPPTAPGADAPPPGHRRCRFPAIPGTGSERVRRRAWHGTGAVRPADRQRPIRTSPTTAAQAAARGAAGLRGAPTPSEVIAGLRATSHGEDLVQLLSPEGVFTPHEDFPIEVTGRTAARPVPGHGAGPPVRPGGQRPAAAGAAEHLGSVARPGGRADRRRPGDAARTTWPSRPTGSTASPGAGASIRPQLLGIFRGTDQCGWDPEGDPVQQLHDRHRQPGAQRHRLRDGPAVRRRHRLARGRSPTSRRCGEPTAPTRRPSRSSATAPPARATCTRAWSSPPPSTRRSSSTARTTSGRSPNRSPSSPGCRCGNGRPATGFPVSGSTATTCSPAWPSPGGRWTNAGPATAR